VLAVAGDQDLRHYETAVAIPSERWTGSSKGRSTLPVTGICAGLAVHQFTRWLADRPLQQDQLLDLAKAEVVLG
jgi:hypothetical protein